MVKIWQYVLRWYQWLKWIQRLNCEAEEKPAFSSFKLSLDFISLCCLWRETGEISSSGLLSDFCSHPLQSPTKTHHRFILALTGLVYMETLKRVRLEELKLRLEWVSFQGEYTVSLHTVFVYFCTLHYGWGSCSPGQSKQAASSRQVAEWNDPYFPVIRAVT